MTTEEIRSTRIQHGFPKLLRGLGALVLVASAIAFSLQSWTALDALQRYYTFYGFTAALTAAGIYCGVRLREAKGARTFLALATAFLPAHFVQLGAFVLHQTRGTPPQLPAFFVLQAPSLAALVTVLAIAVPTLLAIAYGGFSALARVRAQQMTIAYALGNLVLLLPVRDPDVIGLIALAGFIGVSSMVLKAVKEEVLLKTWEGALAQLFLYVPIACLIARNLVLYAPTSLFLSAIAAAAALFLLRSSAAVQSRWLRLRAQDMGALCAMLSWVAFADGTLFNPRFGMVAEFFLSHRNELSIPTLILPAAMILTGASFFMIENGARYRRAASWIAISCGLYQLVTVPGLISSCLCVFVSVMTIATAFFTEERPLLYLGSGGLGFGLLYHLRWTLTFYSLNPWLSLAIPGMAIILAASYFERRYPELLAKYHAVKGRVEKWG